MIEVDRTLLIVDGKSEIVSFYKKFQSIYHSSPGFRKADCNGKDVSCQAYANRVCPLIYNALGDKYKYIICILDLEGRGRKGISAIKYSENIKREIENRLDIVYGIKGDKMPIILSVRVADIMFENWIIADVEGIKYHNNLININSKQDHYDGKNGTRYLNRMMRVPYKKVDHSPILFNRVRFSTAKRFSPSFKILMEAFYN